MSLRRPRSRCWLSLSRSCPDRLRCPVKSSTMVLRDSAGSVFGALCINLDITAVNQAHVLAGELVGVAGSAAVPTTTFGDDIDSVVDAIVDARC